MAKKTHVKVRLVPEAKPDSPFFYYVKKPAGGEKAKVKLKAKKYNPSTRKHEIFVEKKLEKAYKSIGEVAQILDLKDPKTGKYNTHTIRFWEKSFKQVKPKFFNTNHRYYDFKNVEILKKIKYLLKEKGFKIEGVKKLLNKEETIHLDDPSEKSISYPDRNLKYKLSKISKIVKEIKSIKYK